MRQNLLIAPWQESESDDSDDDGSGRVAGDQVLGHKVQLAPDFLEELQLKASARAAQLRAAGHKSPKAKVKEMLNLAAGGGER
eukprot:SAG31_NODE_690_length_12796_cov_4.634559_4_plen_83_part_00